MTRREIEARVRSCQEGLTSMVHAEPVKWFFIGIGLGILLTVLRSLLLPLALLAVAAIVVIYLLAEHDSSSGVTSSGDGFACGARREAAGQCGVEPCSGENTESSQVPTDASASNVRDLREGN